MPSGENSKDTQFTSENQVDPKKKSNKGILKMKTVLKLLLEQETLENLGDSEIKMTRMAKMCHEQLKKAETGDTQAFNAIGNRLEGQPKQEIESTTHKTVQVVRAERKEDV